MQLEAQLATAEDDRTAAEANVERLEGALPSASLFRYRRPSRVSAPHSPGPCVLSDVVCASEDRLDRSAACA